jgi:protein gp37
VAENSAISWTDDTASPWRGCQEVRIVLPDGSTVPSECDKCYARNLTRGPRMGYDGHDADHPDVWGNPKTTPRLRNKYPQAMLRKINRQAQEEGRRLLFTASMSDLFEEHPMVTSWRNDYLTWCELATHVDHLFLTKRPQNVLRMVPQHWLMNWPQNVWLGYSAGTQAAMGRRAKYGDRWRAFGVPVVFVSIEPQLEPVDATLVIECGANWLITGGESGADNVPGERDRIDASVDWFRGVRDVAVVAFFHKQHGGIRPGGDARIDGRHWHQWPDTHLGTVGGVRARPGAELINVS